MPATSNLSEHSAFLTHACATHDRMRTDLAALRAKERHMGELPRLWAQFQDELLHHLRAEDELLLPSFDLDCYADAARLRSEHREMRDLLVKVDAALSAGRRDEQGLDALEALLEKNFQFEERSLFPWAQRCLQPHRRGEFEQRERARVRERAHRRSA